MNRIANMPVDVTTKPVFDMLSEIVFSCLTRISRQSKREFAGYNVGQRRNLSVIPRMAADIGQELTKRLHFTTQDQAVHPAEIATHVEAVLRACSDENAFRLVGDHETAWEFKSNIAADVREILMGIYAIAEIEQIKTVARETNGWKLHEMIRSDEKPRYKWRHTWAGEQGDDFVAYRGAYCVGRIFRLDYTAQAQKWFWLVAHLPLERLYRECPSAGWEWTAREAAVRVEKCYDAFMRLNGKLE